MSLSLPPTIIGIAGTNGSGKDSIGGLLASRHDYLFVSVTDLLRDELKRRNLPLAREYMRELSAEWRRKRGLGVLVDKAIALLDNNPGTYQGLAIASLRNPGEADSVHQYGGIVLWVDADPRIRYDRVQTNLRGHDRLVDDVKTFGEFLSDEEAEMYHPAGSDGATLSMSAVKSKSDIFLTNNGDDLNDLSAQLDSLLGF